jgi:hypothetical protein
MIGTPGTGKKMLAQRLPTNLPPLTPAGSLETTRVYIAMGRLPEGQALLAPARSARRTTPSATPAWSAAAASPPPARSPSNTTASRYGQMLELNSMRHCHCLTDISCDLQGHERTKKPPCLMRLDEG